MHGQHTEDKEGREWHMCPTQSHSAQLKNFSKGGRKFVIGDCALFQAGNAPPFIGIIRNLVKADKEEGALNLSVNWLYRPDELKLGKGASLDATPNEIFYSFHKDEISSSYLLHPCKVAFLRKGIELPPWLSCFVCRRVYDTTNKRLYWLTDKDYTDEHQVEVDQLLDRTKHEMQTSAHSPGTSQRPLNTPTSSKGGDAANTTLPNQQMRGKKRERSDQSSDLGKREKLIKVEDIDLKKDGNMRLEDLTEKDKGLNSTSSAEQLVEMMIQEQSQGGSSKMMNAISHRILLASIISSTEREDCLMHLVHLGSIPILDDWLQEAHKGKLGDGSPKESEQLSEELLLALLCALEKLPVDLDALKTCMVGKSVRNLKSHKNAEIQKKARKLVDTWKKRVDEEMKSSDEGKSGLNATATTWSSSSSSRQNEANQNAKGHAARNARHSPNGCDSAGDAKPPNPSSHPEAAMPKDNPVKSNSNVSGTNDTAKEEKSSSSSQSHNNSQSWCSGSGKGNGSLKEEGKTPSVTSKGHKSSGATLRSHGPANSTKSQSASLSAGAHREASEKQKASTNEKSGSNLVDKGSLEGGRCEVSSIQRLIVRIPNPARSPVPAAGTTSCTMDGNAIHNRGSSPVSDSPCVNSSRALVHSPDASGDAKCANSNSTNGAVKRGAECKEEMVRPEAAKSDEACCKSSGAEEEAVETCHSDPRVEMLRKESAASDSAANPSSSLTVERQTADVREGGAGILASVATTEASDPAKDSADRANHSDLVDASVDSGVKAKAPTDTDCGRTVPARNDGEKPKEGDHMNVSSGSLVSSERVPESHKNAEAVADPLGKSDTEGLGKDTAAGCVKMPHSPERGEAKESISSGPNVKHISDVSTKEADNEEEENMPILSTEKNVDINSPMRASRAATAFDSEAYLGRLSDGARTMSCILKTLAAESFAGMEEEDGAAVSGEQSEEDALEVARQVAKEVEQEVEEWNKSEVHGTMATRHPKDDESEPEAAIAEKREEGDSNAGEDDDALEKPATDAKHMRGAAGGRAEADMRRLPTSSGRDADESSSNLVEHKEDAKSDLESAPSYDADTPAKQNRDEAASPSPRRKPRGGSDSERPVFDLNEGLVTEEATMHENEGVSSSCPSIPSSSDGSVLDASHQAGSLAAPVAVLSASKGAFLPLSNLVRTNGEQGWKGSAATSAFRPAEPRRAVENLHPSPENPGPAKAHPVENGKQARLLDIDLNVADERAMMEDSAALAAPGSTRANENPGAHHGSSPLRPELDLNRLDESDESAGPQSRSVKPPPQENASGTAARVILDFDLNDGPEVEEAVVEAPRKPHHQQVENYAAKALGGDVRPNPDSFGMNPWYSPASSSVPATMMIPAFPANRTPELAYPGLAAAPNRRESAYPVVAATPNRRELAYPVLTGTPNRADMVYPVLATPNAKSMLSTSQNLGPFSSDLYQGGNSNGIPYTTTGVPPPFSYAGFPFGAGFPFTSASYSMSSNPHISSVNTSSLSFPMNGPQLVTPGGVVPPYARPYLISSVGEVQQIPESSAATWARSSLDLNVGPDVCYITSDPRDDAFKSRISPGISQAPYSQSYSQAGSSSGTMSKRKEPESGFDQFSRPGFKQMTWQ